MWRGVVAQQGRVSLEADLNESAELAADTLRQLTLDAVGTEGTPDGGYAVTSVSGSSSGNATGEDLSIGAGVLYLGGERLELPSAITYSAQPDWLDSATDPTYVPIASLPGTATSELVYLTASEQEVSAVEDPLLADVAIGGPDTAQRLRILQRVRRFATTEATCASAFEQLQTQWTTEGYTFNSETMALGSTAQLLVQFATEVGTATSCQPLASGGYLGADNQMFRVEIVSVDENGIPTIAWGPDDASFLYRVVASPPAGATTTLTMASAPVDSYHNPQSGQAVQLLASAVALAPAAGVNPASYVASPTGIVATVADTYVPGSLQIVLDQPATGPIPSAYLDTTQTPQLFARIWQGTGVATPNQPFALNDTVNGLQTGVTVTLSSDAGYHVGDFWRFALRPIEPAQIYPARYLEGSQPPDGPLTWVGPLATVAWAGNTPTVTSCVPSFENLVELSENTDGCCTIDIGPADVNDGAGLPALLTQFASQPAVTICLAPGTYTLSAPLIIGAANNGLTLKGCQGGVVLTGSSTPTTSFETGLIYVNGASGVSLTGIEFQPVAAPFSAASTAVSNLGTANDTLVGDFAGTVDVAIAVTAVAATDLSLSGCSVLFPQMTGNGFGAGLLATGVVEGCTVTDCVFTAAESPSSLPYSNIALDFATEPPYQAIYGLLGIPYATPTATTTPTLPPIGIDPTPRLNLEPDIEQSVNRDITTQATTGIAEQNVATGLLGTATQVGTTPVATVATATSSAPTPVATSMDRVVVESCVFDGITVASVLVGHVGTTTFDRNVVRNCYGGVWIFSSDSAGFATQLVQVTASTAGAGDTSSTSAYLDPLIKLAYGMGMLLPLAPPSAPSTPSGPSLTGGLLLRDREALLDRDLELTDVGTAPSTALGTSIDEDLTDRLGDPAASFLGNLPGLGTAPAAPEPAATTEVGTDVLLRLTFAENQIDAVLEDSYSGAGLVVADHSSVAGSAIVCGNRIRTRFYLGQAVLVEQVAEATINDNLIANEAVPPAPVEADNFAAGFATGFNLCYSLVVSIPTILAGPAVAITGNVLTGSVNLPARAGLDFPTDLSADVTPLVSVLSSWNFLNTVNAPYAVPSTASGI
jgi:hypothetical protein